MESPNPAVQLHAVSERLQLWIETVSPLIATGRTISPEQMSAVLSELMQAGTLLQRCADSPDAPVQNELSLYRERVQRLRTLLPSLHESLLRERDRLSQRLTKVHAASEWVQASRQVL